MQIEEILNRKSDLSTFLVHLTRGYEKTAKENLESIVVSGIIEARNSFGQAINKLKLANASIEGQCCVCFTETPLEHVNLLTEKIEGRQIKIEPYGIAITKRQGRQMGVNPVWYLDITPGHDWLSKPLESIIDQAIKSREFRHPIFQLTPFVEQFGTGTNYKKDFSWEREWRITAAYCLPAKFIVICPEIDHEHFRSLAKSKAKVDVPLIDAKWSLEHIIARLAGFDDYDVGIV